MWESHQQTTESDRSVALVESHWFRNSKRFWPYQTTVWCSTHFETSSNTHTWRAQHLAKWISMLQKSGCIHSIGTYPAYTVRFIRTTKRVPHIEWISQSEWLKFRPHGVARAFTTFLRFQRNPIPNPSVIELLHSLIRFATRIDAFVLHAHRSITSRCTQQRAFSFFSYICARMSLSICWLSVCVFVCVLFLVLFLSCCCCCWRLLEWTLCVVTSFCCGLMLLWPYLRMWKTNTTQQMAIRNEKIVENMGVSVFL